MNDGSTPSSRSIDEQAHYVASALLARRRPVGTAVSTLRKWKIGDVGDYMRCQREELFGLILTSAFSKWESRSLVHPRGIVVSARRE